MIIYSRNLEEHLQYVDRTLAALEQSGISLSLKRCYFAYPSVKLLGHEVSRLGVAILEEKVDITKARILPSTHVFNIELLRLE